MRLATGRLAFSVLVLVFGAVLSPSLFLQPASAAPQVVSADNTVREWEATSDAGAEVTLDGTASSDDAVNFAWWTNCASLEDLPCDEANRLTENSPDNIVATVLLSIGDHVIYLWAADAGGDWGVSAPITVTVTEPAPEAPVADAGPDQSVPATSDAGAEVTLDGSASTGATSYSWSTSEGEIATGVTAVVTLPIGIHEITLTVTGEGDLQATDTVVVTVNPVAVAGEDQLVAATSADGALINLDGTGSFGTTLIWSSGGNPVLAEGATPEPVLFGIGVHEVTLTASGPDNLSATDTVIITVVPVADAGEDQTVQAGAGGTAEVTLDGTGSIGDLDSIVWSTSEGEIATGPTPTVELPVGVHEITLTIFGPDDVSDSDTVTITVEEPPFVSADATQRDWDATSAEGAEVTLDGSLSSDEVVQYAWWTNCASLEELPCDEANRLTDNSPDGEVVVVELPIGAHQITLWGQDSEGAWHPSETITVTVYPVANAGEDQVVVPGEGGTAEVTLDGTGSIGDLDSIVWSTSEGEIATGPNPTVELPIGVHEITMTIFGPDDVSDSDTVTITVGNPPVANAGEDQTVKAESEEGAEVTLDGSASEGEIVSWEWSTDENPDLATGETANVTLPIGTTTVTLTVTDVNGLTDTDTVDITVTVPVANAGPDQTVVATSAAGAEVTLDGSASIGEIVSWEWSTEDNPDLASGETANVTLPIGEHEITLTVTDENEATDTDTVIITVTVPTGDPTATVTPTRGTVNTNVSFTLANFPPDAEVEIVWERSTGSTIEIGTVQTDAIGGATGTFKVPATPGGANQIHFTSGDTTVSADYEVAPRIKVIPDTVIPGQVVDVSLRGYGQQETVRIRWRIDGVWVEIGTVTTSNTGSANVDLIVPLDADAGQNSVRGDGPEFRQQTNAVTVLASPGPATATVTPTRHTVNTNVDFLITNFPANATVDITWRRTSGSLIEIGTVQTDDTGTATGRFKVPATPGGPNQQITFTSGAISATALFEVAPRIKVLDAGAPGDQVEVSLRGFGRQETVRIRWKVGESWIEVGTVTTSNTGSANLLVTIPAGAAPGNNSVRGDGPQFRAQTNVALVTE